MYLYDLCPVQTQVYQTLSLPVGKSDFLQKISNGSADINTEAFGISDQKSLITTS